MDVEELPMHKDTYFFGYGIDIENPDKMARQVIELKEENQELKEQLDVGEQQYNDLVEEKEELQEQLSNSHQINAQQNEFINWLEDKINFWKDKIFENVITENDWTLTLWRNKLGILEESLSKYKEIIGGNNDR